MNYNISFFNNNAEHAEGDFQNPLSSLPLPERLNKKSNLIINWTPKNPHIYGFKGVDIPSPSYHLTDAMILSLDWNKDQAEKKDTDVSIKVNDKTFYVSKQYLNRSDYFLRLFQNNMIETEKNEVEINDFDPEIVEHFLKFLYTRKLPEDSLSIETIIDIIRIAHKYNEDSLIKNCLAKLNGLLQTAEINTKGLQDLFDLSYKLNEPLFVKLLFNYLLFNMSSLDSFRKIVTNENFDLFYDVAYNEPQFFPILEELNKILEYNTSITYEKKI